MPDKLPAADQAGLRQAFLLLTQALDLLDACGGPADVAAHIEMALSGLRESSGTKAEAATRVDDTKPSTPGDSAH